MTTENYPAGEPLQLSEDEAERRWMERGWGSYRAHRDAKQRQASAGKCQNDQPQEADMAEKTMYNPMGKHDYSSSELREAMRPASAPKADNGSYSMAELREAMKVDAYGDYIFIARDKTAEKVSEGGIVIPTTEKAKKVGEAEDVYVGVVVAAGPGRMAEGTAVFVPTKAKVGDKVLFVPRRSLDVELGGRRFYVTRETDILGRLS